MDTVLQLVLVHLAEGGQVVSRNTSSFRRTLTIITTGGWDNDLENEAIRLALPFCTLVARGGCRPEKDVTTRWRRETESTSSTTIRRFDRDAIRFQ
jgi:hypothetical protein